MPSTRNDSASKQLRVKQAEERRLERESRTHQQQLERLDRMFGEGQGAQKERTRLKLLIDKAAEKEKGTKKKE